MAAARIWNALPDNVSASSIDLFRHQLKTFLSYVHTSGFLQILEKSGKVLNSNCKFSRSGKSWKMTSGMEKFGKVMESVRVDLENYSAFLSIVPSFGYNFACM